jgi:hypothetical protein
LLTRGLSRVLLFVLAAGSWGAVPLWSQAPGLQPAGGEDHAVLGPICGFGQTLDGVRFPGLSSPDQQMLGEISGLHPGESLDREKLQRAMRALFATGRFRNLDAECEPSGQGQIVLSFPSSPNYFVGLRNRRS